MTKKLTFTVTAIILALLIPLSSLIISKLQVKSVTTNLAVRTIELEKENIDYESILNEFEDAKIETHGTLTTFEGYKTIDASALEEFDKLSETDINQAAGTKVKYYFTYDEKTNIVTISAEMTHDNGEIEIEEISGVGFINDNNEIDAVMNIDDESILLSEMNDAGMIQNCGWFKKLIKKVVKVAVVAVTVAAVAVVTAAVVVATAGAAAPALVAAGVGITTSAATGIAAATGAAAGLLFAATIGTAAIQAGTAISEPIAEGVSQVIDKTSRNILAFIISGVEYVAIAVTAAVIDSIPQDQYRFMSIVGGLAFVTQDIISYELAVWGLRLGLNTYCKDGLKARQAAFDAGNGIEPRFHSRHELDRYGNMKKGIYFDHYHTHQNAVAYDALGFEINSGHAFFGEATFNV